MPDPANPRGTNPQAIAARNALEAPPNEASGREAAATLLHIILGTTHPAPPPAMPLGVGQLSPEQQAAWITMRESWPAAVGRILQAGTLTGAEAPPYAIGLHRPGRIEMSNTHRSGQPLSLTRLMEVLAHELSHGMGLRDSRLGDADRPVSAYDVEDAAMRMHQDINLPATGRPQVSTLVRAAQQLFGPK